MQGRMIGIAALLALSGCGGAAETEKNEAAATANAVEAATAGVTGAFAAVSKTAMSMTGDATITADSISFAQDRGYTTGPAVMTTAGAPYTTNHRWVDLFGIMPDTPVEVRPVTAEQEASSSGGGLCNGNKVTHFALIRKDAGTPEALLLVAVFKGEVAPSPAATGEDLCGTFTYAPGSANP